MKILALAILISGCSTTVPYQPLNSNSRNDYDSRQEYINNRNQDLIMKHGYGGCTPNFSTGGCL